MTRKETNKPVQKLQLRGISASIFENKSDKGVSFYKVSITRTYKDGDEWKTTSVYGRDDLPLVAEVSRQAWLTVMKLESAKE